MLRKYICVTCTNFLMADDGLTLTTQRWLELPKQLGKGCNQSPAMCPNCIDLFLQALKVYILELAEE